MIRLIFSALLPMLISSGCTGVSQTSESPLLPMPVVALDDDDLLDCDLCKRGLRGENLWCDETQQGYVGGEVVTSYACFECRSAGSEICASCDEPSADEVSKGCGSKKSGLNTESSDCEGGA